MPRQKHWSVIKGVFIYLKDIINDSLEYGKFSKHILITNYIDSDFAKDCENMRCISAYIFTLCGNCISYRSNLQFDVVYQPLNESIFP